MMDVYDYGKVKIKTRERRHMVFGIQDTITKTKIHLEKED